MAKKTTPEIQLFCDAVLSLETPEEVKAFFDDLCTPQEIHSISQRLLVADMLRQNKPYLEIANSTGTSTATISRVKRTVNMSGKGYKIIFKRIDEKKKAEK
ncbi:MAG: hypothetical protein KBS79_02235 [Lachnospiraceae bacterium]|nr:hypothetical protein [Candidatus Minthocola equi]